DRVDGKSRWSACASGQFLSLKRCRWLVDSACLCEQVGLESRSTRKAIKQSQAHRPPGLGRNGPGLMVGFEKPGPRLLLSGKKGNRPWSLRSNSLRPSFEVVWWEMAAWPSTRPARL